MKSSIFVLSSSYSRNDDVIEITGRKSCNSDDGSCCCGPISHNNRDCCCEPEGFVLETSNNKFFNTIITSIKCSHVPDDSQIGSLSDFQLSSLITSLCLFDDKGFQTYLQENHFIEPHLFLPFKPPRNIS